MATQFRTNPKQLPAREHPCQARLKWLFVAVWWSIFSAHAATPPGPDAFGYSVQATTNFTFLQITNGSPRVLALQDDTPFTAPIGFSFNFYGTNYTNLSFNPNGLITFSAPSSNYFNVNLTNSSPSNNLPCIAVLWDDWEAQDPWSDGVYYKTTGTAPARQFTVQWNKLVPAYPNQATNTVTFQARLFEGSGKILMSYFDAVVSDETTNVASLGSGATVGIRDVSGQTNNHNLQWSYNQAVITNGLNLLFSPPNHPPVANNDSATTAEDTPITITIKSNDTDTDNDPLTLVSASQGTNGTVTTNLSGTVTYTPATNFFGTDHFTYVISDGQGGSATGLVTVTITSVNDRPIAAPDSFSTYQNLPLTFDYTLLLTNDSDVDAGDVLNLATLSSGSTAGGTVGLSGSNVTYIPALNYSGVDTFNYTITDGHGGNATGLVSVTVIPNNSPIAGPDFFSTTQNLALTFNYTLLLTNDSDADPGDVLTLLSLSSNSLSGGSVGLSGSNITYIPALDFTGADTFNYTITDGHGGSATGLVTVTVSSVNHPPTAGADSFSTYQNIPLAFNYTLLLTNDSDIDAGDILDLTTLSTNSTAGGTVNLSGSNVTYIPALDFTGPDAFNYTISDGHGGSATGLVTVTVSSANHPPTAGADSFSTYQNIPLAFNYTLLLTNDSDIDAADVLDLATLSTNSKAGGTVNLSGSNVTYIPALDFTGPDAFNYTISDGHGGSATGLVTVTVWLPPSLNLPAWQTNGNPLLTFQGLPGAQHTVEASTDFTNWSGIGVASETSSGDFVFEDTSAGGLSARFYRLRAR
jgi:serine/threonine protein phosphatase PrpC